MKLFSRKVPEGRKGFKALFTETAMEIRPLNSVIGLHLVDQALASPVVGGLSGMEVTLRRLKQLFYWKGMKTQVRQFVQECDICQRAKPDRAKREIKIDLIWATEIVVSLLPSDLTAKPLGKPSSSLTNIAFSSEEKRARGSSGFAGSEQ